MTIAVLAGIAVALLELRPIAALGRRAGRLLDSRRALKPAGEDVLLADLTALGLSAGLSFPAALAAAADHVSDHAGREVRRALRSHDAHGDGAAAPLFALADRALVTGAPLLSSIDGYAMSLRRNERAAAVERARRLPVKLLFPLALLILPGFLLLTVGPALLAGVDRLGL